MSLVDAPTYSRYTGDTTTEPDNVAANLVDAQAAVEQFCRRVLTYGTYTETLYVYANGQVYPAATPITSVTSNEQAVVQGAGVWVGWFDPAPVLATYWGGHGGFPPQTSITYSGGWQPVGTMDGPTPALPAVLARIISQIAYDLAHPVSLPGVPAGATSVHVGDVGYSGTGPLAGADLITGTAHEKALKPWRRPQVRGWQIDAKPA